MCVYKHVRFSQTCGSYTQHMRLSATYGGYKQHGAIPTAICINLCNILDILQHVRVLSNRRDPCNMCGLQAIWKISWNRRELKQHVRPLHMWLWLHATCESLCNMRSLLQYAVFHPTREITWNMWGQHVKPLQYVDSSSNTEVPLQQVGGPWNI